VEKAVEIAETERHNNNCIYNIHTYLAGFCPAISIVDAISDKYYA
jgi:hypothetical protein